MEMKEDQFAVYEGSMRKTGKCVRDMEDVESLADIRRSTVKKFIYNSPKLTRIGRIRRNNRSTECALKPNNMVSVHSRICLEESEDIEHQGQNEYEPRFFFSN
jgi:hypothetical protein